jgi:hypothetical protein
MYCIIVLLLVGSIVKTNKQLRTSLTLFYTTTIYATAKWYNVGN